MVDLAGGSANVLVKIRRVTSLSAIYRVIVVLTWSHSRLVRYLCEDERR